MGVHNFVLIHDRAHRHLEHRHLETAQEFADRRTSCSARDRMTAHAAAAALRPVTRS